MPFEELIVSSSFLKIIPEITYSFIKPSLDFFQNFPMEFLPENLPQILFENYFGIASEIPEECLSEFLLEDPSETPPRIPLD